MGLYYSGGYDWPWNDAVMREAAAAALAVPADPAYERYATDLVRSFCDTVAKNGNLLIGIGPDDKGAIPDEQARPLRGLGTWMATNHEAVRGTRP